MGGQGQHSEEIMRWDLTAGLLAAAMGWAGANSSARELRDRSYENIFERNAFGLRPPPTNAPPPPPQSPQVTNIVFTGITTVFGTKKAFFKIPKPDKPNEFLFPMLGENDPPEAGLKVMEIDENRGAAKINHGGQVMTVTFETHGNKASPMVAAAATPGTPPRPGMPGAPGPQPNVPRPGMPGVPNLPGSNPGQPVPSAVPSRSGIITPGMAPTAPGVNLNFRGNVTTLNPVQSRPVRALPAPPPTTLEESIVNMELQRTMNANKIAAGDFPPLPPTEISPQ